MKSVRNLHIGGGAIFFSREGGGGGSSGETKIAEGIRDTENRRFVLYIAFAGKSGGLQPPPPPAPPPMLRGIYKKYSELKEHCTSYLQWD